MQFKGRINKVYPMQSGVSASGKEWSKVDFIFEYFEHETDRYADRVLLSIMNERINEYNLQEGDEVVIGFSHSTREYNGRCFNDVRMYHFEKVAKNEPAQSQQAAPAQPQPVQQLQPSQPAQDDDKLPF